MNINKNKTLSLFVAVFTIFMITKTKEVETEAPKTEKVEVDQLLQKYERKNKSSENLENREIAFNSHPEKLAAIRKIEEKITKETNTEKILALKTELKNAQEEFERNKALLTTEQLEALDYQNEYNLEKNKASYWSKFIYTLSDASNATYKTVKKNPVITLVSIIVGSYFVWSTFNKALNNGQIEESDDENNNY